ncbi:MAG: SufD family Fe-S cluster assembly protein [Francisellaceae bacterium]|jgi:Fe-S cluster assembly protein SufD|nr:SufD family Fe-S cluster assembly protein [Francisellaceae bacterium]MBT6207749.1 SufD family Fe-S cluster assembly protein [Francisellaceae bacterium]MBT6538063.1 SufD family Fe-S cluster assembly protein [Francisellaceae bacterium]
MYTEAIENNIAYLIKENSCDKDLLKLFRKTPYPKSRIGAWKYLNLDSISLDGLSIQQEDIIEPQKIIADYCEFFNISGSNIIVIHDGKLIHNNLNEHVSIKNMNKKKDNCLLNNDRLNHWYSVLNQCLATCTLNIEISEFQDIEDTLYIIHSAGSSSKENTITNTQVNLNIAEHTKIKVTEIYTSENSENALIQNPKSCYHLSESAQCTHTILHHHSQFSSHFSDVNVHQDNNSLYNCNIITAKGKTNRTGVNIQLAGDSASCNVHTLQWPNKDETHDIYLNIDHLSPNTSCNCLSKSIAGANAVAAFTGNITVTSDANFSEASLTNNNLLLSEHGKIFSRPELEIDNDEVKCSHGTTIGQLDKDMIFYLQSRGINANDAQSMLVSSFISPILEKLDNSRTSICSFVKNYFQETIANE